MQRSLITSKSVPIPQLKTQNSKFKTNKTWVIGDIHGCYRQLQQLLTKINFNSKTDTLISVGDLVNRGAQSLEVINFCMSLGDNFQGVLGNHDLSLLAMLRGIKKCNKQLLTIKYNSNVIAIEKWLRNKQLIIKHKNYLIAHAGIAPSWTENQAIKRANKVFNILQDDQQINKYLQAMYGDTPVNYSKDLSKSSKLRVITNYFTRMRYCYGNGDLDLRSIDVSKKDAKAMAWFNVPNRPLQNKKIIFGHWALLNGITDNANAIALDTGCVWGNTLTAFNIETEQRVSVASKVQS